MTTLIVPTLRYIPRFAALDTPEARQAIVDAKVFPVEPDGDPVTLADRLYLQIMLSDRHNGITVGGLHLTVPDLSLSVFSTFAESARLAKRARLPEILEALVEVGFVHARQSSFPVFTACAAFVTWRGHANSPSFPSDLKFKQWPSMLGVEVLAQS